MSKGLTPKQKKFCEYYLKSGNATDAARRAGYSGKTAFAIGSENLKKPLIAEYIQKRLNKADADLVAGADEVLQYFTRVMRRQEMENIVVTVKRRTSKYDKLGKKVIIETEEPEIVGIPSKLSDSNRAAEALAKRYGILDSKQDDNVKVVPIVDDI